MIASLRGLVIDSTVRTALVEVAGVGYEVYVTESTRKTCDEARKKKTELLFWIHHVVREDEETLYGFLLKDEVAFFMLLLSVSGIGPKTALAIMSVASMELIMTAVSREDASLLSKTAGVGKKTAEKIVFALKDKINDLETGSFGALAEAHQRSDDVTEALKSLGYEEREIREAIKHVNVDMPPQDMIKAALKILSSGRKK